MAKKKGGRSSTKKTTKKGRKRVKQTGSHEILPISDDDWLNSSYSNASEAESSEQDNEFDWTPDEKLSRTVERLLSAMSLVTGRTCRVTPSRPNGDSPLRREFNHLEVIRHTAEKMLSQWTDKLAKDTATLAQEHLHIENSAKAISAASKEMAELTVAAKKYSTDAESRNLALRLANIKYNDLERSKYSRNKSSNVLVEGMNSNEGGSSKFMLVQRVMKDIPIVAENISKLSQRDAQLTKLNKEKNKKRRIAKNMPDNTVAKYKTMVDELVESGEFDNLLGL